MKNKRGMVKLYSGKREAFSCVWLEAVDMEVTDRLTLLNSSDGGWYPFYSRFSIVFACFYLFLQIYRVGSI